MTGHRIKADGSFSDKPMITFRVENGLTNLPLRHNTWLLFGPQARINPEQGVPFIATHDPLEGQFIPASHQFYRKFFHITRHVTSAQKVPD